MSKTLLKAAALEAKLAKLAGPDWESDEEGGETTKSKKTSSKKDFVSVDLPGKQGKQSKKDTKATTANVESSAVVYLGHIPHGFFEDQMKGFLSQFGEVLHLRLSRSKKTAKSRGYAFVEFASNEVATIVADTMNGYYLEGRKLVCHLVDPKNIHEDLFVGADRKFKKISWRKMEREKHSKAKTATGAKQCLTRLLKSESKRRQRLSDLGIEYDFPGFEADVGRAHENIKSAKVKAIEVEKGAQPSALKRAAGADEEGNAKKRPRKERAAKEEASPKAEKAPATQQLKRKKPDDAAESASKEIVKAQKTEKGKSAASAKPESKKATAGKEAAVGGKRKVDGTAKVVKKTPQAAKGGKPAPKGRK